MHTIKRITILFFIFIIFPNTIFSENIQIIRIRPFRRSTSEKEYKYQILKLLLDKTSEEYGGYKIEIIDREPQERVIKLVIKGDIHLIMTMTSLEREERLIPIRIPIYKGMYGYRIFIINQDDIETFAAIKNEQELQKLWAGQGIHWPDYKILETNGYKVTGSADYFNLFDMLERKRFDYFPRGIHEPWLELKDHQDKDFVIEKTLCIYYPAPGYIFVSPKYPELAERLEKGFKKALIDGSFDTLFFNHPDIKEVIANADLKNRLIFELENSLLSDETPLNQDELWYKPK